MSAAAVPLCRWRMKPLAAERVIRWADGGKFMNPWLSLPHSPPFVLPEDAPNVSEFNARARPPHHLHLEIVPEPYLGNPTAPVVLLGLNPGFSDTDVPVHEDPRFNGAARANLRHEHPEYPFYLLDPALPSPGQRWWLQRLRKFIEAAGLRAVASNVFVMEIHGYHSRQFASQLSLPSQRYTKALVRAAIERGARIVLMRGKRVWEELVPELRSAPVSIVRNVQNPSISPGNLPEAFDELVSAVGPRPNSA
jgi:hypothetical protein